MKVFGVAGWKNTGKTGLMERLVAEITGRGFRVSTVKHAHHRVDVDKPGKDSFRHRAAGASEVLLSSANRWALMHELRGGAEPPLPALLAKLAPCDLVLIEGYKTGDHPKIETSRSEAGHALMGADLKGIRAVAADYDAPTDLPLFDLDDTAAIADFILAQTGLVKAPPKGLRDDCFALPPGVNWVPVNDALARLRDGLSAVTGTETVPLAQAAGRIAAYDLTARRANPPAANSAVDGYGFAIGTVQAGSVPLVSGRAAAGAPFSGAVPAGQAVRILTGALLPEGVDTVVLQEDVSVSGETLHLPALPKRGANTRRAGEDVDAGAVIIAQGTRLRSPELALLAATGTDAAAVFRPLKVGVLSTGDELASPASDLAAPSVTYDANRPMLLSLLAGWGYEAVDLGHAPDDRDVLRTAFDKAAASVDVVLTSGGASAGDEDHVSALLRAEGTIQSWRIAVKPGRPLALALWKGVPVFGLPGNPVAALVCSLIFARPALSVLAGGAWLTPQGFDVPAAFAKSKKPGRREYLRARMGPDGVEVFKSEGSGRISGLSWADGLVELPDEAADIRPGMPVHFLPYASFGLI